MNKIKPLLLLSLNSFLLLTSCGSTSKRPAITSKDAKDLYFYKYDYDNDEFIKDDFSIKTYFFNNKSIPYFSVSDYVNSFLHLNSTEKYFNYSYTSNGGSGYVTLQNNNKFKATARVNTDAQTLTFDSYSGFNSYEADGAYPLSGVICSGGYIFKDIQYTYKEGTSFSIDLTKYNIQAYFDNNEIYLPYHVCMTSFNSYRDDYVYNGNGYYNMPAFSDNNKRFAVIKAVRDNIANNAFDEDYMNYAYNHLAYTFDNFFGLDKRQKRTGDKKEHIYFKDGAYKSLEKYKSSLLSTSLDVSNDALMQFYDECVNDGGHSSYSNYNLFTSKLSKVEMTGEIVNTYKCEVALQLARAEANLNPQKFGTDFSGYTQTINNVLFVTIDEFMPRSDGNCTKAQIDSDIEYGKCAVTVLGRANKEVQNNRNIKNVVLDMSCNPGGAGFMPLEILSWINKGNMNFTVKNNNDKTVLKGSGHADVNLDGVFDSKDYLPDDVNVYFICSPGSFSSGNYVCCLASEVDGVKFIGDRSGGGSCNIASKINAYGSSMNISGFIQLCMNKEVDGQIVSDEYGVIPEFYPISLEDTKNASKFFDRNTIVNKILG